MTHTFQGTGSSRAYNWVWQLDPKVKPHEGHVRAQQPLKKNTYICDMRFLQVWPATVALQDFNRYHYIKVDETCIPITVCFSCLTNSYLCYSFKVALSDN